MTKGSRRGFLAMAVVGLVIWYFWPWIWGVLNALLLAVMFDHAVGGELLR